MSNTAAEHKHKTQLTSARSKRGKCARCQKCDSTMLHWRAYDLDIIPWPDVCSQCWDECERAVQAVLAKEHRA